VPPAVYATVTALWVLCVPRAIPFELSYRRLRSARKLRGDQFPPELGARLIEPFRSDRDPTLERLRRRMARLLIAFNIAGAVAVVLLARYDS
jgi:hypothetical protein